MEAHLTTIGTFPRTALVARGLLDLGQAARPRQWIKNLACFAGLVFSGHLFDSRAMFQSVLAFVGFCLSASAVYLLNDVVDRRLDRLNPSKRERPIAAGRVPVRRRSEHRPSWPWRRLDQRSACLPFASSCWASTWQPTWPTRCGSSIPWSSTSCSFPSGLCCECCMECTQSRSSQPPGSSSACFFSPCSWVSPSGGARCT